MRALIRVALWRLTLQMSRLGGGVFGWLRTGWRVPLLPLVAIAGVLAVGDRLAQSADSWYGEWLKGLPAGPWLTLPNVIGIYVLALVLSWTWSARQRVVVEEFRFADPKATDDKDRPARGLTTLLVQKLYRLGVLFHPINEPREVGTAVGTYKERALGAAMSTESPSDLLRGAVSTETKFGLGPFQVPVGALLAVLGRFTQGPRIVGVLYQQGDHVALVAQWIGGATSRTWRVDGADTPLSGENPRTLDDMTSELGARIFNDVALGGAIRWKAVWCFAEGLAAYRAALRTPDQWRLNLLAAREHFLDALSDDAGLDLAHYNLGLVHAELDKGAPEKSSFVPGTTGRAEASLSAAIKGNPARPEPYYALALIRVGQRRLLEAIELCQRVMALRPAHVEAHDLRGLAELELAGTASRAAAEIGDVSASPAVRGNLKATRVSRERAAGLVWRQLCGGALAANHESPDELGEANRLRTVANRVFRGLGVVYSAEADASTGLTRALGFRKAEAVLRESLKLLPSDGGTAFQLGELYRSWGRPAKAALYYARSVEIDPDQAHYSAELARALARSGRHEPAKAQAERALRLLSALSPQGLRDDIVREDHQPRVIAALSEVYRTCGDAGKADRLERMPDVWDASALVTLPGSGDLVQAEEDYFTGRLEDYTTRQFHWEAAQCAIWLANRKLPVAGQSDAKDPGVKEKLKAARTEGIELLNRASDLLQSAGAPARTQRELRLRLAAEYVENEEFGRALPEAHRALQLDPLNPETLNRLGQLHHRLDDHDKAIEMWRSALFSTPNDPELHWRIGQAWWSLAGEARDHTKKRAQYDTAETYLKRALQLYPPEDFKQSMYTRYWLGRLGQTTNNYDQAILHFKTAKAANWFPLAASLYLSEAYFRLKLFDESEVEARGLVSACLKKRKDEGMLLSDTFGEEGSYETWTLAELMAWAYWVRAYGYVERSSVAKARRMIMAGSSVADVIPDRGVRAQLRAQLLDCRGWCLYRERSYDEAIVELRRSIELQADSEIYLHLGHALAAKARDTSDPGFRAAAFDDALRVAQLALETDIDQQNVAGTAKLIASIEADRSAPKAGAKA